MREMRNNQNISTVGPNKFYIHEQEGNLGLNLQVLPGIFFRMRPAMDGFLANIQVKNGAFFRSMNLADYLGQYTSNFRYQTPTFAGLQPNDPIRRQLDKIIKNLHVKITYRSRPPHNEVTSKFATICGFCKPTDSNKARVAHIGDLPSSVEYFDHKRQAHFLVSHYFQNVKPVVWQNSPCVNIVSEKKPTYIPADMCTILAG
jgi:hypothetical protein